MQLNIAWWNLENLFSFETDPQRDDALRKKLASELKGWTAAVRDRKLDQLASIIVQMFGDTGPDLLGVCEVENEDVLTLLAQRLNAGLPQRDYKVATHPSPDARGIDVSFLFDDAVLEVQAQDHYVINKLSPTRDLFWIEVRVRPAGLPFIVFGNHWPSRSGGQYASEPFRMMTGETLSYKLGQLLDQNDGDPDLPVLLMGDFNDEPFNRALQEYLLGTRDRGRVMRAKNPMVHNLMWPLMGGDNPGTYCFGSDWNMLDQFLGTRGILNIQSDVKVLPATVAIFIKPEMLSGVRAKKPRKFGRPSKKSEFDPDGYSDHFPITMSLKLAD